MSIAILGVVLIILGMLAMMAPGITGLSVAMVVGVLVLIGGIGRIIWAFHAHSLGKGIARFALGGLTLLCGIVLVNHPIFTVDVLTILLAMYFVVDGIFEIFAGFRVGTASGGGWLFFGGIISILLGLIIWTQFPLSGAWAIGILLGIKLVMTGFIMVTLGSAMRQLKA